MMARITPRKQGLVTGKNNSMGRGWFRRESVTMAKFAEKDARVTRERQDLLKRNKKVNEKRQHFIRKSKKHRARLRSKGVRIVNSVCKKIC